MRVEQSVKGAFYMFILDRFKIYIDIIHSNTAGAILALIRGKRVIPLSNAYVEYFTDYLFSVNGVNYNLEYALPMDGLYSFDYWVAINNYYIKKCLSINLEKGQKDYLLKHKAHKISIFKWDKIKNIKIIEKLSTGLPTLLTHKQ